MEGQAHGRSGASRAGRTGGGRREGGIQTPHVTRGSGGIRCSIQAGLPVRDCVVGHESPGEAASRDGSSVGSQESGGVTLRCGAAGTCLCRSTKAHGGLIPDLRVGRRSGERTPAGRGNAARVGRKPITVLVRRAVVLEAPRNSTRGRTGRREAASGTPSNPHTSGGPPRSRIRNPSSDLVEPGEWATALRARFNSGCWRNINSAPAARGGVGGRLRLGAQSARDARCTSRFYRRSSASSFMPLVIRARVTSRGLLPSWITK